MGQGWAERKGSTVPANVSPAYRYIATDGDFFIVEYCGKLKRLPKAEYALTKGRGKGGGR